MLAGAREGSRNETLTRLAGHLISPQPLPPEEVELWLQSFSRAFCKPPLPDHEIKSIVRSISKAENSTRKKIMELMAIHGYDEREAREALTYIEG